MTDIAVLVGGIIPADIPGLEAGIAGILPGASTQDIVEFVRSHVRPGG
jgi:methylmalonyl-CoA mutase cobalamin-binding subunit